jgi:chemotaxis protein CheD
MNFNDNVINVATGEVKIGHSDKILVSYGIGSCVVVTIYDPQNRIGAMLHIMLPGKAPSTEKNMTKYAFNAIEEAILAFTEQGIQIDHLQICLVGGGNVLKKKDDSICQNNINSIKEILESKKLQVLAKDIGGTSRRTVRMVLETGNVYYSVGGYPEKPLYELNEN